MGSDAAVPLPRWARGMNEVEWITSRRYVPYTIVSFAISLALCWGFWFAATALPVKIVIDATREFSGGDAHDLLFWIPSVLASLVTPMYGLLWLLEEGDRIHSDREKVRVLFGRRSWSALRDLVISRRAAPLELRVLDTRVDDADLRRK